MKKTLILVPSLFFALVSFAQQDNKAELKVKYGKISEDEIKMTAYSKDPDAPAVILFDKGYLSLGNFNAYERHTRIKIFKKEAYDKANFVIPYSQKGEEHISGLKATCYNMENGKLVETKASSDNMKEESLNKYLDVKKVTIPGVREGSIIEIKYTLNNPGMQNWTFQDDIPTMWSEYETVVPSFYNFTKLGQGSTPYLVNSYDKKNELWPDTDYNYTLNTSRWVQKDVPAIRKENYMSSIEDYRTQLSFYLETIQFPMSTTRIIIGSWEATAKFVMDNEDFGDFIDRKGALKDELVMIVNDKMTPIEKVQAIYEYVGKNFEAKGSYSIWMTSTLRELKQKRKVSTGEMNLIFLNMLKTAGLTATPAIIRTRDEGRLATNLAALRRFNSVITRVKLDKDTFFVDASGYPMPLKLLPINALSGYAVEFLSKKEYNILTPQSKISTRRLTKANLTLNTEGSLSGDLNMTFTGYEAVTHRDLIKTMGAEKMVKEMVKGLITDGSLTSHNLENTETITDAPLKATIKLTSTAYVNKADDKMYISPALCFGEKNNPFKAEERQFNVDFGAPKEEFYQFYLTLPDGYKVEEMPKSMRIQMPENGMKFDYLVDIKDKILNINTKLTIKQTNYKADEYPLLKQFYAQMLAKMGEQIVLVKN